MSGHTALPAHLAVCFYHTAQALILRYCELSECLPVLFYINVNYGVCKHKHFSTQHLVTFLLAQKRGNKREFVEPARARAKKGTLPNAAAHRPARPSLGKEACAFFTG